MSHSTVYSTASTQMLVDSPSSALANSGVDLTGYDARANVFARLMTSDEALRYIGQAAGIPGNLIAANGPIETNGSMAATHSPVQIRGGKDLPFPATYKLSFVQNPDLPTVDVYAQAPTTAQAISLANGAVTGFANLIKELDASSVAPAKRIEVRQLGGATGGIVDSGASKKMTLLVFVAVLAIWCGMLLFVSRLRAQLRAAKQNDTDLLVDIPEDEWSRLDATGPGDPGPFGDGDRDPRFAPAVDAFASVDFALPLHDIASADVDDPTHDSWDPHPTHDSWDPEERRVGTPDSEGVGEVGLRP